MVEDMRVKLENLGPIHEANINFSNITVVGGHNATGKSSLSRFLFSFLKANSFNRQEIAYDSFLKHTRKLANLMSSHLRKNGIEDKEILSKFSSSKINRRRYKSIFDLIDALDLMIDDFGIYNEIENDDIARYIENMVETVRIIRDNSDKLYTDLMGTFLNCEFIDAKLKCNALISNDMERAVKSLDDGTFDELVENRQNFTDGFFVSMADCNEGSFQNYGAIILDDVFYIDSVSILDIFTSSNYFDDNNTNHLSFLKNSLTNKSAASPDIFDDTINSNIIDLEEDINKIISGQFVYEKGEFSFISKNNVKSQIHNTASGIKQMGIIQLLLANRKLRDNCVLIIDEPEVNLHPEWQMKFAEVLVLISKKLNVSIYINTHSPLFLEAIYTFSNYYGVADKTKYHLAEAFKDGLYDISEVEERDLSKIYDDLGKPYLAMDVLRIEKTLE